MVGLAVAVVEDGEIRFIKGYGVTVAGGGEPVTPDTVFRWASLVQGRRRRHGRRARRPRGGCRSTSRSPATPPRCACPAATSIGATVADLLSHRLGLFGHAQDAKLEDGIEPRYLRGTLATLHNICAPGTCHAYQNVAYDAASEIVERVTGRPYGEVVRERLFAPLGMTGASIEPRRR